MEKNLNTWRNLVKSRNYDPNHSVEEIMARQTDGRVNPEKFQHLVNRWMKPEYQVTMFSTFYYQWVLHCLITNLFLVVA